MARAMVVGALISTPACVSVSEAGRSPNRPLQAPSSSPSAAGTTASSASVHVGAAEQEAGQEAGHAAVVDAFLSALRRADLGEMLRHFGTDEGPVALAGSRGSPHWQQRMELIRRVADHDDATIGPAQLLPGRAPPAARVSVDLQRGDRRYLDVGVHVVLDVTGEWRVERIELERITAAAGAPRPAP